ncbi:uncharacterized protein [Primulina eburnea]|uniref:uncharacterized protein n=1 Tax=Primulina eburnea TaxID=1245227 RepID=UPI003C6CB340
MEPKDQKQATAIDLVTSGNSPEFTRFSYALTHSSVIGLDAEWKPNRSSSTYPTVSLLQIACRLISSSDSDALQVFLVDLQEIQLLSVYELLKNVFVSPNVIKLGFRFKQDLVFLSYTFCQRGCEPGFDRVEPFIDITAIYNYLRPKVPGQRVPKQHKSLATVCEEVLGILLSKELQCSDWSKRPLTEEQKIYAAADAHCLVEIFNVFRAKVVREANIGGNCNKHRPSVLDPGLKIFETSDDCSLMRSTKYVEASDVVRTTVPELCGSMETSKEVDSSNSYKINKEVDNTLLWIVRKYGDRILLKDSDGKPKISKKKTKKSSTVLECKQKTLEVVDSWHDPSPWDPALGGDGSPKFLCDVMVEGLAKHLRCVGVDAAVPYSKRPDARDLIDQALKEKRVLLTRDAKLLRHEYLIKNQLYKVKSLLKNEQLLEVIETFQLKISEDQLMTRCTKCNGRFIQKPLTTEEAVEASKGFQVIPNCLFNKNIEFWKCMDCHQLYWEGTQYHNAIQKFMDVCKLNE